MTELMNDQFICFACRNTGCDSYTFYRGYLICEYCLDDWLKEYINSNKILDFEIWCGIHKDFLDKNDTKDNKTEQTGSDTYSQQTKPLKTTETGEQFNFVYGDKTADTPNSIKEQIDEDYAKTKEGEGK